MDFRIAHVSIFGWAGELLAVIFNAKKLRAPADRSMRKMRSQSCRKKIRKVAGERWTRKSGMIFGFCCRLWRLAWSGIVYSSKRAFVSFRNRPLHSRKIDLFIFGSAATHALFNTMKKSNVNVDWFRECEFDQSARVFVAVDISAWLVCFAFIGYLFVVKWD